MAGGFTWDVVGILLGVFAGDSWILIFIEQPYDMIWVQFQKIVNSFSKNATLLGNLMILHFEYSSKTK